MKENFLFHVFLISPFDSCRFFTGSGLHLLYYTIMISSCIFVGVVFLFQMESFCGFGLKRDTNTVGINEKNLKVYSNIKNMVKNTLLSLIWAARPSSFQVSRADLPETIQKQQLDSLMAASKVLQLLVKIVAFFEEISSQIIEVISLRNIRPHNTDDQQESMCLSIN